MDIKNEQVEHSARNDAQAEQDAADAEYFANIPNRCAVEECDQVGTETYHVCPVLIVDPEEERRWPTLRFCKAHMREIMGE
jgi:hypothetical protein